MRFGLLFFLLMMSFDILAKPLVYCSVASPKIFNPQLATDGPSFNAAAHTVYSRLVSLHPQSGKVVPSLAESWKINRKATVYTFSLRKNISFHSNSRFKPTRFFNADDVLFSFDRMRNKKNPYHYVNGGTYEYFSSMGWGVLIKDIVKVTDYKVKFILNYPDATFLTSLFMPFSSILSKEYADKMLARKIPEVVDFHPIGTGPYIFKKYIKDSLIRYVANKKYYKHKVPISKLVFSITSDPSVRFQKLKRGECHVVGIPSPVDIPLMRKLPHVEVKKTEGLSVGYLAFNTSKKPFNNIHFRKAVYHALNRPFYIQSIYKGLAKVANQPLPPAMWGHNSALKDYDYNIEKAKKFLKKANYNKSQVIELWTLPVSRPYIPYGKKLGELMQADLAKIGVKVKLVTYKWATYLDKVSKGEHQMAQLGWTGDIWDPDNFLFILLSCPSVAGGANIARWCNKNFDQLVVKGKKLSSRKLREPFYRKASAVFHQQVPWVPLAYSSVYRGVSKNIFNYTLSPFGFENFSKVSFKKL